MIIDLKTIPQEEPKKFEICLNRDWWRADTENDQVMGFVTPLNAEINIYRAKDKYVFEGSMEVTLELRCDRCLESYPMDLSHEFRLFLALPPSDEENGEVELLEEDMETYFIHGDEIELNDVITEQLYLSLPIKSLCRPDCLGLCPVCGNNLNYRDCGCERKDIHPGLLKLKNIKIEGK